MVQPLSPAQQMNKNFALCLAGVRQETCEEAEVHAEGHPVADHARVAVVPVGAAADAAEAETTTQGQPCCQ